MVGIQQCKTLFFVGSMVNSRRAKIEDAFSITTVRLAEEKQGSLWDDDMQQ